MMEKYFTGRWNDNNNFGNNPYWQPTSEYIEITLRLALK